MRLASLGSGSKGNATLIRAGDTLVLVDCGFAVRETCERLARLGLSPADLSAVVVTHEHGDHIRGVLPLARRYHLPVHMTFGTLRAISAPNSRHSLEGVTVQEVRPGRAFSVGDLAVMPVPVPHDAREPCQYVFESGGRRTGVLTDLGSITTHVTEAYSACDALLLECNHDPAMLAAGPYPFSLKRRVGGDLGHLSNQQAGSLVRVLEQHRLQHLVLSHLSEQNNTPAHAMEAIAAAGLDDAARVRVACQQQGFDWLEVN